MCPVKLDLHDQLVAWRGSDSPRPAGERRTLRWAARVLASPLAYRLAGRAARALWPRLGKRFRGMRFHDRLNQVQLLTMSAVDFLDQWFETDVLKATMSASGIIGTFQGVRSPGTAYVAPSRGTSGIPRTCAPPSTRRWCTAFPRRNGWCGRAPS